MSALERMLDANVNRACEGLRTLEDLARFLLDDGQCARKAKEARHLVRSTAAAMGARRLVAWRDTPGDVGTTISAVDEGERSDAGALAMAAGNRAGEALRACEEAAKVLGLDAGAFERCRYEVYDIQKRLVSVLGSMKAPVSPVCVLVTESMCQQPWEAVVEAACRGGAASLQLREKDLEDSALLERAMQLMEVARPFGVLVFVFDRPDFALLAGASGVLVGQGDLSVGAVRRLCGDRLMIGVSCSTLEMARRAAQDGADYLGLGPMFPSGTKRKDTLSGSRLIERVVADPIAGRLPHLAISGIEPANLPELVAAGCQGVAVCGAVCGAQDPEQATRALVDAMTSAQSPMAG